MQTWKTLNRKTILQHSQYLTVEEHTVELPDGRIIQHWPWIITRNYIIALARTTAGKYLCFRQTKYGVEGTSLATVGGYLEAGEAPEQAARRELMEETGLSASIWDFLGAYRVDGNNGAGMAYLYFADQAEKVSEPHADDLEEQELLELSREQLQAALLDGEFKVLAWALAVSLSLLKTI